MDNFFICYEAEKGKKKHKINPFRSKVTGAWLVFLWLSFLPCFSLNRKKRRSATRALP